MLITVPYNHSDKEEVGFRDDEERESWEAEQKRLDREWYGLDEGYSDEHNPFSGMSEAYQKRKEEEVEKKKKMRMSARQRQINKVGGKPGVHIKTLLQLFLVKITDSSFKC